MTESDQPLSPKIEQFLAEITRDFGHKPSILTGAIERIEARQRELKEIESLPEPERSFRTIGYNQTNFTFAYGAPNIKKMTSEGIVAVVRDPFVEHGFRLGTPIESYRVREKLHVPDYKDTFLNIEINGLEFSQAPEIFEALPENVVVKLFAAVLTEEDRRFLIENTSRQ